MTQTRAKGTEVTVPHLAESLVSATVSRWLKQPGDYIEQYDVICELITEKVNVEMPSPVGGTLVEILVEEGRTAAVGEAICIIEEPGSAAESWPASGEDRQPDAPAETAPDSGMRGRYSPAVQRLAAEHGVDLLRVPGTGIGGRILRNLLRVGRRCPRRRRRTAGKSPAGGAGSVRGQANRYSP